MRWSTLHTPHTYVRGGFYMATGIHGVYSKHQVGHIDDTTVSRSKPPNGQSLQEASL